MKPDCAIFDIDGTLADTAHRAHYLERKPKDWPAFYAAMVDDPPREAVCLLLRALARELPIICTTGRPEGYRRHTQAWLNDHHLPYAMVMMRADGDHRVVKCEMLTLIRHDYEPVLAVDDRAKVVKMWRAEGLTCLQCAEGDF